MDTLMVLNFAAMVCAGIGVLFGAKYLLNQKNMYAFMIVLGVACFGLGRAFQCIRLWTGDTITGRFQPGILGLMGGFSWFFSANFGQIDSLVDDGSEDFRRYRRVGLLGPACVAVLMIPIIAGSDNLGYMAGCVLTGIMIAASCYFHVKHLWIPDVEKGIVYCMRRFNAMAAIMSLLCLMELNALTYGHEPLLIISYVGQCIVLLLIIPIMERGVKKWTT